MTKILQIDREAAWPYSPSCYKDIGNTKEKWTSGVYDGVPVINAFASHREQATRELVRALEEIVSRDRPTYGQGDFCEGQEGAWSDAADIARSALTKASPDAT